jgi:hypothetical protein
MVMSSRSPRSHRGTLRWLLLPVLVTLVLLVLDAAFHARSTKAGANLGSEAWVDRVLPEIAQSSAQGSEVAAINSGQVPAGPPAVSSELSGIASAAAATYTAVVTNPAPSELARAADQLQACLSARKAGTAQMAAAVQSLLDGDANSSFVTEMLSAASEFKAGDNAYRQFAMEFPKLGVTLPASAWPAITTAYRPTTLATLASKLLAGVTLAPQHQLAIDAITTNPPALRVQSGIQILSPTGALSVIVVIGNNGQSQEKGIQVTATITPSAGGNSQQVTKRVDLSEGQADAVLLGGLRVVPSAPTTLTVGALEPNSEPGSAYQSVTIVVPGPGFTGVSPTTTQPSLGTTGSTTTTSSTTTSTTS